MDILFGDSEALKNDEAIELTRLEGGRYRIYSPKAELERMQLLVQKEKKNRIYYYKSLGQVPKNNKRNRKRKLTGFGILLLVIL